MPFMMQPGGGIPAQRPSLYVGDLEEQITEELLYNFFSKFGHIYSLKIMRDIHNKKSRGFAFIQFY